MKRITEIELAGKQYPLNFSVKAAKAVDEKFGSLDQLSGVFGWGDITTSMYNVCWMLELLMEQGAAYKKLVDGETVELLPKEELETIIGPADIPMVQVAILESIGLSMKPSLEVEPDEKNVETTQGK